MRWILVAVTLLAACGTEAQDGAESNGTYEPRATRNNHGDVARPIEDAGDGVAVFMRELRRTGRETIEPTASAAQSEGAAPIEAVAEPAPPPAPIDVTTPVYEPPVYEAGSIEALVASYGWDTATAFCVVQRESNWNPAAINPSSYTVGLFQIRPSVHAWRWESRGWTYEDMMTPGPNVEIAWELYQEQGWSPWDGSPGCWN